MEKMYHPVSMFEKIELHLDHNNKWRWRISKNGRIIASASNGYDDKKECMISLRTFGAQILRWIDEESIS